ncbi:alpha/beta hydrolase, partial [Micromonospora musae]|uniref:alpha/beta fold hydrolase n=1 Tax=Micromonospora musae TaxID=1894970 RepID=UPI0033E96D9F
RETFYSDLSDAEAKMAVERLVDQSLLSCVQPTTHATWRTVPSTYVICTEDRQFPVALQEQYAVHATDVVRIPTGHTPMLSAPDRVADILTSSAAAAIGR